MTDYPYERVNVLGVNVACLDVQGVLDLIQDWSERNERRTILYINAHCLNEAFEDSIYHRILNNAELVYSDGISVVWSARFLGGCRLHKMTGADWIFDFCQWAERNSIRTYILAGKPGIANKTKANLLERWTGLKIVGTCDGYFIEKSESDVLEEIAKTAPHVVFVGMGTPVQEKWIASHRDEIQAPVCWAVGALFDYVAGVEPRVPVWLNAIALEWLWRLIVDPGGKWRRYIIGNPLFVSRVVSQWLGKKKRK